ncbi:MAG: glucosaminidase domain-containing protein [Elainella sp. Prado103]|jgi:hypothetical protein|nr:glucosaminidase domain-containing protein [Elainella sp. Prado103]
MGRVFVAVGHGAIEAELNPVLEGGVAAQTASLLQDLVVNYLRSNQYEVAAVPDYLTEDQMIRWINHHAQSGDVAAQLHVSSAVNPTQRGTRFYHIAANEQRRTQADQVLQILLRRTPQLLSQGIHPDTQCPIGHSRFCRQLVIPSLLLNLGFITNIEDRQVLQAQRQDLGLGLAEGLAYWSRSIESAASLSPVPTYPAVNVNLNGALIYGEGILAHGNFYVPIDLVDQLGIELPLTSEMRRLSYRNVVYVRAIDLSRFQLSIHPDKENHTLILRSMPFYPGQFEQIMGRGMASEVQMIMFLKSHHPEGFSTFAELPKLYREESAIEGVNADIAFAQMCVETDFLRFGGTIQPEQNNFAGLGGLGDAPEGATFRDLRIGVRAQIQHLKAYASPEPLVQESVDPRFRFVRRGIAPTIDQLSGRWSADLQYGQKLKAVLRALYESAGFF